MKEEDYIGVFRERIRELYNQRKEALKKAYSNESPSAGDVRLWLFNEHLNELKTQLQYELNDHLLQAKADREVDYEHIKKQLTELYKKIVDEFYRGSFN